MTRVAVVQMTSGADVAANLAFASATIGEAASGGAALVVLPENFAFMSSGGAEGDAARLALAEPEGEGVIQGTLAELARRHRIWLVAGTIPLRDARTASDGRVAAACLVFGPDGRQVARYDKIHLFDVAVPGGESHHESRAMRPGTEPKVVDTDLGVVGLSVCYDLRFPELYRTLVARGATLLTVPAGLHRRHRGRPLGGPVAGQGHRGPVLGVGGRPVGRASGWGRRGASDLRGFHGHRSVGDGVGPPAGGAGRRVR
jgi:nitrilase